MLKNTREYLINELREVVNNIKESQAKIEDMKVTSEEAKTLVNSYDLYSKTKSDILGNSLMDITICVVLFIFLLLFLNSIKVLFISSLGLMGVGYFVRRVMDIKKFQKAKRAYHDIRGNVQKIDPEEFESMSNFIFKFYSGLGSELKKSEIETINTNKEYLQALWDILSSDDFIDRLVQYFTNYSEEIETALIQEWHAYLDEITKEEPSKIHFASSLPSEYCYKEDNFSNNDVKVLEISHHPLAIFQTNDITHK